MMQALSKILECIPDLTYEMHELTSEDEEAYHEKREVRNIFTLSGTPEKLCPFMPFMPIGQRASFTIELSSLFDKDGRLSKATSSLSPMLAAVNWQSPVLQGIIQSSLQLAFTSAGCRLMQKAASEASDASARTLLLAELKGHVWKASESPHANHVLQEYIMMMTADHMDFILEEFNGRALEAAQHRFQCRVLQRLIEHCRSSQTQGLIAELLDHAAKLFTHPFGNFVIASVLEHGTAEHKSCLAKILLRDIWFLSRHKIANNIVRKALVCCAAEDSLRLAKHLKADSLEFSKLAKHAIGSFVAKQVKLMTH
jgi:hypothetical protein